MTPAFSGPAIELRYASGLRDTAGNPAHAATFIRRRIIILDAELRADAAGRASILAHEIFHFVWVRLANATRVAWEERMRREMSLRVAGEAGWSAEWRKQALRRRDVRARSRAWREYCCESFCDTGAVWLTGSRVEATLPKTRLRARIAWLRAKFGAASLPI